MIWPNRAGDGDQAIEARQAAGGEVGDQAARARVVGDLAEPRQVGALAAAERQMEHAALGQRVDGALPLRGAPLAGRAARRGPGVAALAAGAAAVGELQVRLERRPQRRAPERAVVGRVRPGAPP